MPAVTRSASRRAAAAAAAAPYTRPPVPFASPMVTVHLSRVFGVNVYTPTQEQLHAMLKECETPNRAFCENILDQIRRA